MKGFYLTNVFNDVHALHMLSWQPYYPFIMEWNTQNYSHLLKKAPASWAPPKLPLGYCAAAILISFETYIPSALKYFAAFPLPPAGWQG